MIRQNGLFGRRTENGARSITPAGVALLLLEDAARRMGLEVKYGDLRDDELTIRSGVCQLRQRAFLVVDKRLGQKERAAVIARELARMDLEAVYLPPAARELIETLGR